ncbi:MAG: phosphate acyltransferase PlsX [Planctomycetes bacterium]|nr:phosphate acyltransferase PlsX [Planctomycetota bacterium]
MVDARIALDAMGGDRAPQETVRGAIEAVGQDAALHVVLVGREPELLAELETATGAARDRIEIFHASEVVGGGDSAAMGYRKEDGSIRRACELVKADKVDGLVAAGNTAATVTAAVAVLKRLPRVRRPGIAVPLPTAKSQCILCDAGANIHCKPVHLFHYGIMASLYFTAMFEKERPTIGLMNIGSEEGKGTGLVKETARLFSETDLNFIGNVEGNDVFNGRCDVIICEGFVGNVILKTAEGLYKLISHRVHEVQGVLDTVAKEGNEGVRDALRRFRSNADWSEQGGAPLLGINGMVLICHGRSDSRAIRNGILQAARIHRRQVLQAMAHGLVEEGGVS